MHSIETLYYQLTHRAFSLKFIWPDSSGKYGWYETGAVFWTCFQNIFARKCETRIVWLSSAISCIFQDYVYVVVIIIIIMVYDKIEKQ